VVVSKPRHPFLLMVAKGAHSSRAVVSRSPPPPSTRSGRAQAKNLKYSSMGWARILLFYFPILITYTSKLLIFLKSYLVQVRSPCAHIKTFGKVDPWAWTYGEPGLSQPVTWSILRLVGVHKTSN
jgi:hypothetical protein